MMQKDVQELRFEYNDDLEKKAMAIGFCLAYVLFTTVLFSVFLFLKKIPDSWGYFHFSLATAVITAMGYLSYKITK